jgi:hypothetical protein
VQDGVDFKGSDGNSQMRQQTLFLDSVFGLPSLAFLVGVWCFEGTFG